MGKVYEAEGPDLWLTVDGGEREWQGRVNDASRVAALLNAAESRQSSAWTGLLESAKWMWSKGAMERRDQWEEVALRLAEGIIALAKLEVPPRSDTPRLVTCEHDYAPCTHPRHDGEFCPDCGVCITDVPVAMKCARCGDVDVRSTCNCDTCGKEFDRSLAVTDTDGAGYCPECWAEVEGKPGYVRAEEAVCLFCGSPVERDRDVDGKSTWVHARSRGVFDYDADGLDASHTAKPSWEKA